MNIEKTSLYKLEDLKQEEVRYTLKEVYDALEERGYNAKNQIVGFLISGDLGYISSYKDARKKMQGMDRAKIMEVLLDSFQKER